MYSSENDENVSREDSTEQLVPTLQVCICRILQKATTRYQKTRSKRAEGKETRLVERRKNTAATIIRSSIIENNLHYT